MEKSRIQIRSVSNVAASKTALIELPVGPRYHSLYIQHGFSAGTNTLAGASANLTEIRVKVGGRVQRVMSAAQLHDVNALNGAAYGAYTTTPNTAPGVTYPIFFAEPWRDLPADQDALAWATAGWPSFQVEVDIGAASTPTLKAWAIIDNFAPQQPSAICKWLRLNIPAGGSAFDYTGLDMRDYVTAIHLYTDSGTGNSYLKPTLRLDNVIKNELDAAANVAFLTQNGMTPAATGRTTYMYDMVFDHDGLLNSAINFGAYRSSVLNIQGFTTVDCATAQPMSGTITAIVERVGLPE